jgi:acyl carrier protein
MSKTVKDEVIRILADDLGHDVNTVTPEKRLAEDLGADSLDAVELSMTLEDEFNVLIKDEEMEACKTVQDVVDMVTRKNGP